MTTLTIELPDTTVEAAREAGLLTPQALDRLLNEAMRRKQAADSLLSIAGRVAAAGIEPMSIFTSRLFRFGMWCLKIRHQRTEIACPWQNGRIERFFGTLCR